MPATFCAGHRNIKHISVVASVETVFMRLDRLDRNAPQMFQHVHYSRSKWKIECMRGRGREGKNFNSFCGMTFRVIVLRKY